MNRKLIGLYQLITGIFGVIIILANYLTKSSCIRSLNLVLLQVVLGVLVFSSLAWAGYAILNNVKNSKQISMALQAFQIPTFAISGILYKFSAAAFLSSGFNNGKTVLDFTIKPIDFMVTSNSAGESYFIIYLIPVLLIYGLSKL